MPQSLAQVYLHVVFSTKNRTAFFIDREFRRRVHAYLAGTCENLDCPSIRVGGVADHIHILCRFGRGITLSDFIRELKRESSKWIKEQKPSLDKFYWQNGYGAFSVSPGHVDSLHQYIVDQEEHHQTETFQPDLFTNPSFQELIGPGVACRWRACVSERGGPPFPRRSCEAGGVS